MREFEQHAIGAALMLNNAALSRGIAALRPYHFRFERHRTVWQAITQAVARRESTPALVLIDVPAVADELRRVGKMDAVGVGYLMACVEGCPSAENIDYYAGRVREASALRCYRHLAEALATAAGANDADAAWLAAAVRQAVQTIEVNGYAQVGAIFERR